MSPRLGIYESFAPLYLARGLVPLPVKPDTKACKLKGWNEFDPVTQPEKFTELMQKYSHQGIGLRMGSRFSDGTFLAAVDVDKDAFVAPVAYLLGNPPSGRIGAKGAAFFVRCSQLLAKKSFKTKGGTTTGDMLMTKALCVIPPTIHPETSRPYEWIGKSLLEIDYQSLPLIEL